MPECLKCYSIWMVILDWILPMLCIVVQSLCSFQRKFTMWQSIILVVTWWKWETEVSSHPKDSWKRVLPRCWFWRFVWLWKLLWLCVCVCSQTGFLIMDAECPIIWQAKLHTGIALSTMEADIFEFGACCREICPILIWPKCSESQGVCVKDSNQRFIWKWIRMNPEH